MIVNIGPWWVYDIIVLSMLIGSFMFGLRRGFFTAFYILFLELITVIVITFIPALIANALIDEIMKLWNKTPIPGFVDSASAKMGDVFYQFLKFVVEGTKVNGQQVQLPDLTWDGLGNFILKALSSFGIYIISCIAFIFIINFIGFIFYFFVRRRLRAIKIYAAADAILGGFNGLAFGLIFVIWFNYIVSFPFFATETQKLGILNYNSLSEEQKINWAKEGNSYSRYSVSNKIGVSLPVFKTFSYVFTNACLKKYVLNPMTTIFSQLSEKGFSVDSISKMPEEVLETYSLLMLNGYVETNPAKIPISVCVELMPNDNRILLRMVAEMALVSSKMAQSYIQNGGEQNGGEQNGGENQNSIEQLKTKNKAIIEDELYANRTTSIELMNAFEAFKAQNGIEDNTDKSGFMTKERFKQFYEWAGNDASKNPFLKNISSLSSENAKTTDKRLAEVLQNPEDTYNLLKNMVYVNKISTYPTIPNFIPSIWSDMYFARSMELSYTQSLYTYFTRDLKNNWDLLNPTAQARITRDGGKTYEGFSGYWIQHYFDFAKLGE
ncbi:CvpA family protein [Spiroplasma gladiatoris]|uniref:CvpA family protein n=1 Tax=Spiroplasma gladiatoris TaxID=2143 RepID=A0A4P7AJK2_9MOLU|nr:hypothetical protein [Spiroplasma gladiatoris]QBQ07923.1 CvpA family protein [Spiroplasma gladiatoris]